MREDLAEIALLFHKKCGFLNLTIPTNGTIPDKIIPIVERILTQIQNVSIKISISFDGLPEIHNDIRGLPNAFDKAYETFKTLKSMQKNYKNLTLITSTVFQKHNKNTLKDFFEYAAEELNCDDHVLLYVRNITRGNDCADITPNDFQQLVSYLEKQKKDSEKGCSKS